MTIGALADYLSFTLTMKICYDDDKVIYYGNLCCMPEVFRNFEIENINIENDVLTIYINTKGGE